MDDLSDQDRQAAGKAFADVHSWAATAWRLAGDWSASRAGILADVSDIEQRLAQLRKDLGGGSGQPGCLRSLNGKRGRL